MSCFRGQMNEYSSIAIDRFDGKNLQCTAFFLSHCHKDHMVGLNYPYFLECLSSRENVFLYCSEITRLLLLAEEEYVPLDNYIHVLDVGMPHLITVPSNSVCKEEQQVNVTLIPAGHCPGSVMFLFEGPEGTSLYTGDFRWEIGQVAKMAALKEGDRPLEIKSLYVDTTFCIPEAYHIPSRAECVEATVTLISNWLQHSLLHVVNMSCPARFGHEHLLMELASRLDTKIHVPEWKVQIYDQIANIEGVFTSDPSKARVHACSMKISHSSLLPCHYVPAKGKRFRVLNIRPSTMWFTSEKSRSRTEDLIVAPVSQRGLHRVCYSMHSSYSEIRDLVSYIQPKQVLPNVLPMSDVTMDKVQERLNSFLRYPNKRRMEPLKIGEVFQPLGTLRKNPAVHPHVQRPPSADSSSEDLVFSSQETSPRKVPSVHRVERAVMTTPSPTKEVRMQSKGIEQDKKVTPQKSSLDESLRSSGSKVHSSYNGSASADEELNLFSDEENNDKLVVRTASHTNAQGNSGELLEEEESLRLYVSGESEVSDNDNDDSSGTESESDDENKEFTMLKAIESNFHSSRGKDKKMSTRNLASVDFSPHQGTDQSGGSKNDKPKLEVADLTMADDIKTNNCIHTDVNEQLKECTEISGDTNCHLNMVRSVKSDLFGSSSAIEATKNSEPRTEAASDSNVGDDRNYSDKDAENSDICIEEDDSEVIPNSQDSSTKVISLFGKGMMNLSNTPHSKRGEGMSKTDNQRKAPSISSKATSTGKSNLITGSGVRETDNQVTITILSSSEESQNIASDESQTLWNTTRTLHEFSDLLAHDAEKSLYPSQRNRDNNFKLRSGDTDDPFNDVCGKFDVEGGKGNTFLTKQNLRNEKPKAVCDTSEDQQLGSMIKCTEFTRGEKMKNSHLSLKRRNLMTQSRSQPFLKSVDTGEHPSEKRFKTGKEQIKTNVVSKAEQVVDCIIIDSQIENNNEEVNACTWNNHISDENNGRHKVEKSNKVSSSCPSHRNINTDSALMSSSMDHIRQADSVLTSKTKGADFSKNDEFDKLNEGDSSGMEDGQIQFLFEKTTLTPALSRQGWTSKEARIQTEKNLLSSSQQSRQKPGIRKKSISEAATAKKLKRNKSEHVDLTLEEPDIIVDLTEESSQ